VAAIHWVAGLIASPAQHTTQDLWDAMNVKVLNFMQSVTLKSLVLDQLAMDVKIEQIPLPSRGVFKRPVQQSINPNVPKSVFALGRTARTHG
jgi:Rrf2 family iron-sulfur cluster assembly transcriptional regulator